MTSLRPALASFLGFFLGLCASAQAQGAPEAARDASAAASAPFVLPRLPDAFVPPAPADDTLYRELGGKDGVAALVEDFNQRLLADARVERFFRDADPRLLKERLAVQICEVAGGPCRPASRNIRRSHSGHDIRRADFMAVVEVLQQAMDARGIGFGTQNRLLARLAPMHRDIVNAD